MNAPPRSLIAQAIDACVGILRLRKGPEDIPASNQLLLIALCGAVLLRIIAYAIPSPESLGEPVVLIPLELGINLAGVMFALRLAGYPERFTQTMTAILGCQLVCAPLVLASRWMLLTYLEEPGIGAVARIFYLAVVVWLLVVTVRILRSASGWPMLACFLLVLGIELLTVFTVFAIYPPPAADAPAAV